jgi:hypothetical protein
MKEKRDSQKLAEMLTIKEAEKRLTEMLASGNPEVLEAIRRVQNVGLV